MTTRMKAEDFSFSPKFPHGPLNPTLISRSLGNHWHKFLSPWFRFVWDAMRQEGDHADLSILLLATFYCCIVRRWWAWDEMFILLVSWWAIVSWELAITPVQIVETRASCKHGILLCLGKQTLKSRVTGLQTATCSICSSLYKTHQMLPKLFGHAAFGSAICDAFQHTASFPSVHCLCF